MSDHNDFRINCTMCGRDLTREPKCSDCYYSDYWKNAAETVKQEEALADDAEQEILKI